MSQGWHLCTLLRFQILKKSQEGKINRGDVWTFGQVTSARARACLCVRQSECKWLRVRVTKWRPSSAARVPDLRGPSEAWKGRIKKMGWGKVEEGDGSVRRVVPLTCGRLNKFTGGFKSDYICHLIRVHNSCNRTAVYKGLHSNQMMGGAKPASAARGRLAIFYLVVEPQQSL